MIKQTIFVVLWLLACVTTSVNAQINANPDPNGEPWWHSRQANSCKSLIMSDDSYFSPRSFGEQGSLL
jgi:hypothetical protein